LITVAPKGVNALEGWRSQLGRVLGPAFAGLKPADIATLERAVQLLRERTTGAAIGQVA
jgi:hypothetical protein